MTGERGFTIMESLVALAVLAVMLVAMYEAIGTGFRTFDRAAAAEEAVLVAQSQLDSIVARRRLPDLRGGNVDGTRFAWRLDVTKRDAQLATLKLGITWAGSAQGVTLERLVLLDGERVQ
jgi:prepilin-type N-terminal cleavage/methylation domain-containing protein